MNNRIERRIRQIQDEDRQKREQAEAERKRQKEEAAALKAEEERQERAREQAQIRRQEDYANRLAGLTVNERRELDSYSVTSLLQELRRKRWKKGEITNYVREIAPDRFAVGTQLMYERKWTKVTSVPTPPDHDDKYKHEDVVNIDRLAVEIHTGNHYLIVVSDLGYTRLVGMGREENTHVIGHEIFPTHEQKMEQLEIVLAKDTLQRFKPSSFTVEPWYKRMIGKLR